MEIGRDGARYELLAGEPLELLHHGEPVTLLPGSPQTRTWAAAPETTALDPPPGRAPLGTPL